jgi:hypothetical protein
MIYIGVLMNKVSHHARETSSSNRVSLGFIGDPELIGFGINRSAEASAESVREKSLNTQTE